VRWRPDGQELFYIALDGRLVAVPIHINPQGSAADVGKPVPLFVTHIGGAVPFANRAQYMVAPDGRFLMNTLVDEPSPPITLLNWKPTQQ
jgi:hypothetical protein